MKIGEGNGNFVADCFNPALTDEQMRERWKNGDYDKPRPDYVKEWRRQAGRG